MYKSVLTPIVLCVSTIAFGQQVAKTSSTVLQGIVTDQKNIPIRKALLYTVLGEDETISDQYGRFSFKTQQPLPIKLVAQSQDFEEATIVVSTTPGKLTVILKRK